MRAVNIIYVFILTVIILGGLWMSTGKLADEQIIKKEAIKYLAETYQEEFSIEEYAEKSLLTPSHHFRVKSHKYQRSFNLFLKENAEFEDNYFSLQFEAEANRYFKELIKAKKLDVQTRVVIYNNKRPKKLALNASFKDFINTGEALIFLYIISDSQLDIVKQRESLEIIESCHAVQLGSFIEITNLKLIKNIDDPVIIMSNLSVIKNKADFKMDEKQHLILEDDNFSEGMG